MTRLTRSLINQETSFTSARMGAILLSILLFGIPASAQVREDGASIPDLPASSPSATSSYTPPVLAHPSWDMQTERQSGRTLYRWSVAAVLAGNAADIASSWHRQEANPLLANPGSKFDVTSVALKSGFVGASLLLEYWALHHNPHLYKALAWMNFGVAGGLGAVVEHNVTVR